MTYQIDITEPAERDMIEAARYIAVQLHNRAAADRLLAAAEKAIYSLEETPNRQPLVRDEYLASKGIRLLAVHNYLVLYTVREEMKKVVIQRFLYGKRDWINILKGKPEPLLS
jgi:toxin ParE1/3/4